MVAHSLKGAYSDSNSQMLWEDGELVFRRSWRLSENGQRHAVLIVRPAVEHPSRSCLNRLAHEYELKDQLDGTWAVRPLDLVRDGGRTLLVLEDVAGEPLGRLLGAPMEVGHFLRISITTAAAVGKLHQRGLVHRDIKPANILVNDATGEVWLTGFGIASRFARDRQSPRPPETIAGTLAYMAPEQTGRMNLSIDSRSDLYALGVNFYQMLTGDLPFTAADPMEWVHGHLAKRPMAPAERLRGIPGAISAIVMKLLAKRGEDRYQTAAGLESDLRRCQREWDAQCQIDIFTLGEHDTPDQLLIPEKLYGRQREVETLLAAFNCAVKGDGPQLVLVSGFSGIGKSSLVNELQRVLVLSRGLFAAGKFDQYKRDVPYSTLAQAFQSLVRPLLTKSDVELGNWSEMLREALGPNGRLMVDLVPELKLIIGEQSSVPELPPQHAQRRFQLVFRRFLTVFARPEHPLALFLDDLQWLDAATLDLLEDFLTHPDVRHVLLIGAYRDNEVTAAHPLMGKLEAIRATGRVQDIKLGPLSSEDLDAMVSDSLRIGAEHAVPLIELVHAKTDGNPFFVIQFLHLLADEKLLVFDHEKARWSFDPGSIQAKQYTDNVVELLAGRLTRLPPNTRKALQQFASLGNISDVAMLSIVLRMPEEQVDAALWEARHQQLIERLGRSYKFVHDRVQEAAYASIPEELRAEAHLTNGRLLVAHTQPQKRDEAIFEIVNQFNRGAPLITSTEEREQVAELNLAAGRRAISSSAYATALTYLTTGAVLLSEEAWARRQELAFSLELHLADCEICMGALRVAVERLAALALRAADMVQRCAVVRRRVDLYTMLGESRQAVAVGLECLRHVDIDWPMHPTEAEALAEYERMWVKLGSRAIEDLVDLPLMHDAESLATLDLLTVMMIPTHYTDGNLNALIVSRAANLCLERGNSDAAPVSYAAMGLIASARYGDHDKGYRLGKMACSLIERHGLKHFGGGAAYRYFADLVQWKRPLKEGIDLARRAFQMGKYLGHPTFAALAGRTVIHVLLASGHPLDQLEHEAEQASEFVRPFGFFLDRISASLALVRMLRGKTTIFGSLDDGGFAERSFEQHFTGNHTYAFLECYYWIRKLQARFFANDYVSAVDAADKVERLYATYMTLALYLAERADFYFYAALSRAACCEPMGPDPYAKHREALQHHEQQLCAWAKSCPQNFEDRAALVGAESARLEGRPLDAMDLYERAIAAARSNGFVHNEALAYELAARFYASRGFKDVAHLYLGNARRAYLQWGADGKVRQLDQLNPRLVHDERGPGPMGTIEASVEQLDLATVIEVSQALSGELDREKLINRIMRAAIEHAGAERGLLISPQGQGLKIDAEATAHGEDVAVHFPDRDANASVALPESITRYALRTRETVILDNASSTQNAFSSDPYIVTRSARSILCLPLINQGKLIGILYLENNLMPHVFTPARIAVLKVLASQAAISLENTRLYRDLAYREGKIRRLVDANIIGIFVGDRKGRVVEANDAFLRVLGYDREDLVSGRVRWADLTPPEWRERDIRALAELNSVGTIQPFEKEYLRKDGSRIPVLVGGALFEEGGNNDGVCFVLDLTEQKCAETAMRESEGKFRDYAETASDWFWEIGPDYKYTSLTENAFGSDPAHRIGTACWDHALDLETEPEKWRLVQSTLDSRQPFRDFVFCADGGNGPMFVKASGKPAFDSNGEFRGYRGTGTDVTEIVRAQEALYESERRLRSAIDGIPGLVAVLSPNGDFEAINRQIVEYCGRSLEELKSWSTNGIIHHEDLSHLSEVFTASIASGVAYEIETRLRRFDGEYRWFHIRGIPVRDTPDRVARWYVLLTDIDDRTQALTRLQQMQADFAHINRVSAMGELAGSLSHEILHPIATARNNARAGLRFLDMNPPNLIEAKEAFGCVVRDADRAKDIVGRLRDQIKKAPPRRKAFDLNGAVRESIDLVRSAIASNRIVLSVRLQDGPVSVHGDSVQLQQVIVNLILNAVEAMSAVEKEARELSIRIGQKRADDDVLVQVLDSGPGIDPANVERVFEPFYTTKVSGIGVGLSICRSIISGHGGRLWVEANEPRGAVFQFTLPPAQEDS